MEKILELILKALPTKTLLKIALKFFEKLAEKTENDIDDEVLNVLEKVLKDLNLI